MPLKVVVVEKSEVYRKIKEYRSRGYTCRADENGDWECVRPINELMTDIHVLIIK